MVSLPKGLPSYWTGFRKALPVQGPLPTWSDDPFGMDHGEGKAVVILLCSCRVSEALPTGSERPSVRPRFLASLPLTQSLLFVLRNGCSILPLVVPSIQLAWSLSDLFQIRGEIDLLW